MRGKVGTSQWIKLVLGIYRWRLLWNCLCCVILNTVGIAIPNCCKIGFGHVLECKQHRDKAHRGIMATDLDTCIMLQGLSVPPPSKATTIQSVYIAYIREDHWVMPTPILPVARKKSTEITWSFEYHLYKPFYSINARCLGFYYCHPL